MSRNNLQPSHIEIKFDESSTSSKPTPPERCPKKVFVDAKTSVITLGPQSNSSSDRMPRLDVKAVPPVRVYKRTTNPADLLSESSSSFGVAYKYLANTCETRTVPYLTAEKTPARRSLTTSARREFTSAAAFRDSNDVCSEERRSKFKKPCSADAKLARPPSHIGKCNYDFNKMARMSTNQLKIFLTQDPRKKDCLVNPAALRFKTPTLEKEMNACLNKVKYADNVCFPAKKEKNLIYCETVDLRNPLNLDFQGLDYQHTYRTDEQDIIDQQQFKRIARYMDRKRVKKTTAIDAEERLKKERLAVPPVFQPKDWDPPPKAPSPVPSLRAAKLYRTSDKVFNARRLKVENDRRHDRYEDLYLRKKLKDEENRVKQGKAAKEAEKNKGSILVKKGFDAIVSHMKKSMEDKNLESALKTGTMIAGNHNYPPNLRATRAFKQKLKTRALIERDIARTKKEFFQERLNQVKSFPEAEVEFESGSDVSQMDSLSTQTTDNEDEIEVGRKGSKFRLRGFLFKNDYVAGKKALHDPIRRYGCMTRDEWIASIMNKKKVKIETSGGVRSYEDPNDPNLRMFKPVVGPLAVPPQKSAIRKYIQKRLGRQYELPRYQILKLRKPRLPYTIKKFNLIKFVYGEEENDNKFVDPDEIVPQKIPTMTTKEYLKYKRNLHHEETEALKEKFRKIMNLSCYKDHDSSSDEECENLNPDTDEDWVPEKEQDMLSIEAEYEYQKEARAQKVSREMRANMPASMTRESTFRRHPHRPRDYEGLRVPSIILGETVHETHIPHLQKLQPDKVKQSNVDENKEPFDEDLKARRHHDLWDPTQTTTVRVQYQPKIVKPQPTPATKEIKQTSVHYFKEAEPICNAFVNMDLTYPKLDATQILGDNAKAGMKTDKSEAMQRRKRKCQDKNDFCKQSRDPEELKLAEYPGRQEYLDFLEEIRTELYQGVKVEEDVKEPLINKSLLYEDLEEDLKSIESCLSSLDSSICTNFTNDSGSMLLIEGKTKVPLDYIRKAIIPFEELNRSRFQVEQCYHSGKDKKNVFEVKPWKYVGDAKAKDTFFTFTSRLYNGLRLRLEVPVPDVRKTIFGYAKHKHAGLVATDIDELYIDAMNKHLTTDSFGFKSDMNLPKDCMRMHYESMLFSGQVVRFKIWERLNEMHWDNMHRTKAMILALFNKLQKKSYEVAMEIMREVKAYYFETDDMRAEIGTYRTKYNALCADVVFMEGGFSSLIVLQNFLYLIGHEDWRHRNDWMHRSEEEPEKLEPYDISIENRTTLNMRDRENADDATAVYNWFMNVYLPNKHPVLDVFCDVADFFNGFEALKSKTFLKLLKLHHTLGTLAAIQHEFAVMEDFCEINLVQREKNVTRRCAKQYFMEHRAKELYQNTVSFCEYELDEAVMATHFIKIRGILAEAWRRIIPSEERGVRDSDPGPEDMAAALSEIIIVLLTSFEDYTNKEALDVEMKLRFQRLLNTKTSKKAYQIERRVQLQLEKVMKTFEPPYVKPKRTGKLPRYYLTKKIRRPKVEERRLSDRTRLYLKAFVHDYEANDTKIDRDSVVLGKDVEHNVTPFYFDHFLRLNGYTPNYSFKTQIEARDGPEVKRITKRELLPEIMEKMARWEEMKERVMEINIKNNRSMYENIQN